ncbi:hypothetical protein AMAG_04864 [Allomyces macrogynus ATCC 38327]|uniref:Uncharacterized protein n=1 Tax=Allomyces macrogynus (strain ATCC 38327) TaxID=578462 RepID=A0A0L0S6T9_ALLM3|nr:hypothetical protein AMAG_04864 [Allomyces macrogynus ATCC 38327]|eukprot:KNE58039.1 hypothetical protein AMAG_04864 [Allomyces macrogynus ATCC 38327]
MLSVEVPQPHGTAADHDSTAPGQVASCDANAAGPPSSAASSSSSTPPAPRKSATPLRLVELRHYQHKRHLQERRRLASNRLRALRTRQPLLVDQDANASGPAALAGPVLSRTTSHDSDRALVLRGGLQLTAPTPVLSAAHRAFHDEGTAAALVAALQREGALLFPLITLTPAMTVVIIKALWHNLRLMSPWALEQAHRLVSRRTSSAQAEVPSEPANQDIAESGDGHGNHNVGNDEEADAPTAHRSAFSFTATSAPAARRSSPLDSLTMQSLTPANCIRQTHCIDLLGVKAYAHPPARNAALHGKFTLPQAAPLITSLLTKTAQLADLRVDIGLFANSAALATTLDQLPVLSHLTLRDVAPGTSTFVNGKLIYSIFGHQYLRSLDLIHVQLMHSAAMHSHLQPRNATHPISRAPLRQMRLVADRFPMVCAPGQPDTAQALALLLTLLPHLHVLDLAAPNFPTPLLSAIFAAPSLTTLNLEFGCRVEWPTQWVPPAAPTGLQGTRAALMSAAALVARVTGGATPAAAATTRTTPSPLTKVAIQSGCGVPAPLWAYLGHFPNLVDVSVHSFNDDQIRAMHIGKIGAKLQRLELVGVDLVPPFAVTALAPHLSTLYLTEYIFVYHAMALAAGAARTGTQLVSLTLGAVVLPTKLVPPTQRPVVPEGKDEPLWHDMPLPVWLAAWLIRFQPRLTALSVEVVNDMESLADLAWLIKRSRVRDLTLTVRACRAKARRCAARDGSELARTCHCALRPDQIRGLFNAVPMPMSPVPPSPRRANANAGNAIRVRIPTFQACHHTIKRTARAASTATQPATTTAWTAGPPVLSPMAPHMVPLPASPARQPLLGTPPRAIVRPTAAKRGIGSAATGPTSPPTAQQALAPASPLSTPRKRMRSVDEDADDTLEAPRKRIQRALDRARAAEPAATAAAVVVPEPELPVPPAVRQRRNVSWSKTREVHEVSKWIGDLLY